MEGAVARRQPQATEWNSEWEPYLEKHLEANAAEIAYVKEQAALGTGGFEVDWTQGINAFLPHLSKIREAARTLSLEAVLRAKRGDVAGAYEDVRLMFRLRRLCADEPTLIARLVSIALDSIAISALHGTLEEARLDRASAQALAAELEDYERRNSMTSVFIGETAMGLETLEKAKRDPSIFFTLAAMGGPNSPPPAPNRIAMKALRLVWNASADEREYLRVMRRFRELSRREFPERKVDPFAALPQGLLDKLRAPFTHMMTPALGRVLDQEVQINAKIAMARAAIGLELYRAEKGAYPETLDALVPGYLPAVPTDPFDLKPVRYVPSGDSFTIYTVGLDGQDQGGARNVDMLWVRKPQVITPMAEEPEAK